LCKGIHWPVEVVPSGGVVISPKVELLGWAYIHLKVVVVAPVVLHRGLLLLCIIISPLITRLLLLIIIPPSGETSIELARSS
jgi:hypothetical protein